jgi:hypothetical protein
LDSPSQKKERETCTRRFPPPLSVGLAGAAGDERQDGRERTEPSACTRRQRSRAVGGVQWGLKRKRRKKRREIAWGSYSYTGRFTVITAGVVLAVRRYTQ